MEWVPEVALSLHHPCTGTILHSSRYKLVNLAPASDTGSCLFDGVFLIANASELKDHSLECSDPLTGLSILHQRHLGEQVEKQ